MIEVGFTECVWIINLSNDSQYILYLITHIKSLERVMDRNETRFLF